MIKILYSIFGLGGAHLGEIAIAYLMTIATLSLLKPSDKIKGGYVLFGTLSSIGSTQILASLWSFVGRIIFPPFQKSSFPSTFFLIIAWLVLPIFGSLLILIPLARFFRSNFAQQGGAADAGTARAADL